MAKDPGLNLTTEIGKRTRLQNLAPKQGPLAPRLRRKTQAQEEKEWVPKGDPNKAQKMRVLLASFSEEQLTRYEGYRQSTCPSTAIRHVVQSGVGDAPVELNALISRARLAKVFVGEVEEEALDV
ncbi:Transcription initiation factor TFIID subunit 11 [Myotis davidii]|uniref:Transcription initiation factor TFIID subunit 11 n=1 Tax=Myotis davidii TaxID=225400 RepID=L5LIM4_MYODS|nr:Transcription initiation factor TFIID subunit 11 [Myotis davidii]